MTWHLHASEGSRHHFIARDEKLLSPCVTIKGTDNWSLLLNLAIFDPGVLTSYSGS